VADLTKIINGPWIVEPPEATPPEIQLLKAMDEAGLNPPDSIHIDGRIHRFNPDGKPGNKSGWYVIYPDGITAGAFGDWKTGLTQHWCAQVGRELTLYERIARDRRYEEAKAGRDAERARTAEIVSETVADIWNNCAPASAEHPYLKRKGVQPHIARVSGDGRLVLPLYDEKGALCTLQYISGDGSKKYHTGGPTKGKYAVLGYPGDKLYIAEGFATAASIYEATKCAVAIAYTAGNLSNVAGLLRERYGNEKNIVIVADNDESGTGQREAAQAGERWNMPVIIPPIPGDANDYAQAGHDLLQLLQPDLDDWLVQADTFCEIPAPIKWLVKRWIQEDALIMVHGPSGSGKTFVVLDWCLRIAAGLPSWNGNRVKEGGVVYLAGEGHWGLKARVAAWKHHHGIKNLTMWLSRDGCDLNTGPGYRKVVDHIRALPHPPRLIVVDTLHRFLCGDENKAQDAKTMLDACAALMREFGCSVLLVHHTGVSEEAQTRARGSSAWRGALDVEISVIGGGDGKPLQLVQRKQKDGELERPVWVELHDVYIPGWYDEDGERVKSAVVEPCDAPQEAKKDTKLAEHKKMFERAWFATGSEIVDGRPYIDKKKLLDFLIQDNGITEGTARNMLKPSHTNKLIGYLTNGEVIKQTGDGWGVFDNTFLSVLLTMR